VNSLTKISFSTGWLIGQLQQWNFTLMDFTNH